MGVRAVIFDYGMVLTGPPAPDALAAILRITGLSNERLQSLYGADRPANDDGKRTGLAFWQKLAREADLSLCAEQINELNDWDAKMWTTQNPAMIAWQNELKERGILTAILSNMGDHVHARMEREFAWLSDFDLLVWSYKLGIAKPDPAIYLHTLKELKVRPGEALFLDDKLPNVEAACRLGMKGVLFTNVEALCADLTANGLDKELPLPR